MRDATAMERIAALKSHPGWPELQAYYRDRLEEEALSLGYTILNGGKIDQEALARRQGEWRAMKSLLASPASFESMLREFQYQEEVNQ